MGHQKVKYTQIWKYVFIHGLMPWVKIYTINNLENKDQPDTSTEDRGYADVTWPQRVTEELLLFLSKVKQTEMHALFTSQSWVYIRHMTGTISGTELSAHHRKCTFPEGEPQRLKSCIFNHVSTSDLNQHFYFSWWREGFSSQFIFLT